MSTMDGNLRELYQEVIFDHNRKPRNFHDMPRPTTRPTATIRCAAISSRCSCASRTEESPR